MLLSAHSMSLSLILYIFLILSIIFQNCIFFYHLTVVLAFGVKESMSLNNLFTVVNMAVVLFVIVAGAFKGTNSILFLVLFEKSRDASRSYWKSLLCCS